MQSGYSHCVEPSTLTWVLLVQPRPLVEELGYVGVLVTGEETARCVHRAIHRVTQENELLEHVRTEPVLVVLEEIERATNVAPGDQNPDKAVDAGGGDAFAQRWCPFTLPVLLVTLVVKQPHELHGDEERAEGLVQRSVSVALEVPNRPACLLLLLLLVFLIKLVVFVFAGLRVHPGIEHVHGVLLDLLGLVCLVSLGKSVRNHIHGAQYHCACVCLVYACAPLCVRARPVSLCVWVAVPEQTKLENNESIEPTTDLISSSQTTPGNTALTDKHEIVSRSIQSAAQSSQVFALTGVRFSSKTNRRQNQFWFTSVHASDRFFPSEQTRDQIFAQISQC